MQGIRLLLAQFFAILVLAVVMWVAVWFSLYWRVWWLDIPMHLFGGVWAALCAAWFFARRKEALSLVWCLVFALTIGVVWEIFEYVEGIAAPQYLSYSIDTAKDILMDLLGAVLGWIIARK